jgi:hypothetical protein
MGDFVIEVVSHASPTSSTHVPTFETTAAIQRARKRCCLRGLQADCLSERWSAVDFIKLINKVRNDFHFLSNVLPFLLRLNSSFSENPVDVNAGEIVRSDLSYLREW